MFLGQPAYPNPKGERGPEHAGEAVVRPKTLMATFRKTRLIWQKLDSLKPNPQSVNERAHRYSVWNRCPALQRHEP
jgi:hypothetical protein